jgi:hypothetical protein
LHQTGADPAQSTAHRPCSLVERAILTVILGVNRHGHPR